MISSTNLTYIFGEWIGMMHSEKYLLLGIKWSLLALIVVPIWIFCYVYLSVFVVLIYDKIPVMKEHFSNGCVLTLAYLWDIFGRIWHGYELHGIENLPEGSGLIIYYHGAIPLDYIFFIARLYLVQKRLCHSVVDRFAKKFPGYQILFEKLSMITGTKEACLSVLKCNLLGVSPGGTREALFSDENYKMIWAKRIGFAQLAIDAKVPIIPMFTQNNREGYRTLGKIGALKEMYENLRIPVVPIYGGFPVKWTTYIGEPIPHDPNITAEELAKKAKLALQALIDKHQTRPGSIGRALLERFHHYRKND
ncbi:Transmembrane protein 68 [Varanus komodoensis]|uniref:transmembrane protein 68-like n=1 Tax=Varanus komodoensis TaxID=61221 RepID=UPI001CF7D085|nr:transmembrane protein 68-like [Varanus komodoensis]KAF7246262.1 Transmembrane protein 68 [Varanus komodoensis]